MVMIQLVIMSGLCRCIRMKLSWIIIPAAFQWLKREFILVFVLGEQLPLT